MFGYHHEIKGGFLGHGLMNRQPNMQLIFNAQTGKLLMINSDLALRASFDLPIV